MHKNSILLEYAAEVYFSSWFKGRKKAQSWLISFIYSFFFSLFFSVSWDDEINIIQVYIAETESYHLKTFQ